MIARKKILFVITKSNWGGAQRYVYDIATSLTSTEFEVTVACGDNGLLASKLRTHNITVHEIRSFQRTINIGKELSALLELWKLFRTLKPDIVHLNSSKAGGLGALVARCVGVPKIIFTAHGWPFWEQRNIFQKSLIAIFSWLTVLLSHTTICISEFDASIGKRMLGARRKIKRIRNGIEEYERLPRAEARARLFDQNTIDQHERDIWVITPAELTRNKNHIRAIDAVCAYNQVASQKIFYVLMGTGELHQTITAHITMQHAEKNVCMLGFVENGCMYNNAFDALFLPSLKEGTPYVLLEAGLAKLPCIASDVGGIPEIIIHRESGLLVSPTNIESLEKALENIAKNGNERVLFGERLCIDTKKNYSKKQMLIETQHLYLETNNIYRQKDLNCLL